MSRRYTQYMKSIKRSLVTVRSIDHVATYGAILIVIAALALFVSQGQFKAVERALAFVTTSQTDWSNGQGTDPTNQYSSLENIDATVPNKLTVATTTVTGWCATAHCDANWLYRRGVSLVSQGSWQTPQARIHITYDSQMKADFSDIRFVSADGLTEFNYWITSKTDSVSADIIVRVPDTNNVGTLMVYYGNSAAEARSDESVRVFEESHFEDGSINDPYYFSGNNGSPIIEDGLVRLDDASISGQYYYSDFTRIFEGEFRINYSDQACGFMATARGDNELYFAPTGWTYNEAVQGICTPHPTFTAWALSGHDTLNFLHGQPEIHSGDWIYIREIRFNSGGSEMYISYDQGQTYTKLDTGARGHNDSGNSFQISNWDALVAHNVEVRKMKGYIGDDDGVSVQNGWRFRDPAQSLVEYANGGSGSLISAPICAATCQSNYFGTIAAQTSGSGAVMFRVRSGNDDQMQNAKDWSVCPLIPSGAEISSSYCVSPGQQYLQYQVFLSSASDLSLEVTSVDINHDTDTVLPSAPTNAAAHATRDSPVTANGDWMRVSEHDDPYITWSPATDNVGGSGIGGYCLYIGTDLTADPVTESGTLGSGNQVGNNVCPFEIDTPYFDYTNYGSDYQQYNGMTMFFKVVAFDKSGNVSSSHAQTSVRIDAQTPTGFLLMSGPNGTINTKTFTVNYTPFADIQPVVDNESGIAGAKYCVTNFSLGFDCFDGGDDGRGEWYGANHSSGLFNDQTDVLPLDGGSFTTTADDFDRLDDSGANMVMMSLIDNAGNATNASPIVLVVNISLQAPSTPLNLTVNPEISPGNAFSFHWDAPTTYSGPDSQIEYCWSVNTPIDSDASNCTWTDPGVTSLEEGPYATAQGTNTLYLIARDQAGNFESANNAHVTFVTNTSAPGAPQDLDVTDISTRATSNWKLAMSWAPPLAGANFVTQYKILRSSNGQNYSVVGSTNTSNLSFIDTGLAQVLYSYKIQACDNAGACSVYSNVATAKPTGRYTTPATLVTQPTESDIATRKATITWTTDRDSDSRVAIGLAPGVYFHDETGNSTQSPAHKLNLTGLQSNTRYYYVAKWTDVDGNTGMSAERSFMTAPAPVVSDVAVNGINISSASVTFTVENAAGVKLTFGQSESMGGVKQINTSQNSSSYTLQLNELADGTKYFYRINGLDTDSNEYQGNIFSFTTLSRPKITDLKLSAVTDEPSSTQRVTWKTNVPTSTELVYGPQGAVQVEQIVSNPSLDHEMIVRGLIDDSDYTLLARVRDAVGNVGTSEVQRFHTALDTRPPKVSEVSVETQVKGLGKEARGQVIVSWHTDEPSTSQVAFGLGSGTGYGSLTAEDTRLTTEHVVVISDLPTSSVYQLKAVSRDRAANEGGSDNQSAIVGRGSENVFTIIFSALQSIFGIK